MATLRANLAPTAMVALAAWLAVLGTLGPGRGGPGVSCDEYYYCAIGKARLAAWRRQGADFFTFANIDRNFAAGRMHPPLGPWLLAAAHAAFDPAPQQSEAIWLPAARLAPATAFAATVLLTGALAATVGGRWAGCAASIAMALMPRAFADAHFAALDTLTMFFCFLAIAAFLWASRPTQAWRRRFAAAGVVWGLALLTKMNGLLLAGPLILWLAWQWRRRAIVPAVVWFVVGGVTFVGGWPWLWPAPLGRLAEYLSTATARPRLANFYLGRSWADVETPWHYPWVMTAVTLPAGLLLLGVVGLLWEKDEPRAREVVSLVGVNLLFVLAVFSLPGVAVYDGTRLFLIVYPLWAVLAGLGAARACRMLNQSFGGSLMGATRRALIAVIALTLAGQAWGLVGYHPFQTSYYNALIGGLRGAARLGMEINYWGDAIDHRLLEATAAIGAGQRVVYAPQLAPWQAAAVAASSQELGRGHVQLVGWEPSGANQSFELPARLALVYRRRAEEADWKPLVARGRVIAENSRSGVWLARLYELSTRERR